MTNTIPHAATSDAHFSFCKIIVHDLDGLGRFYQTVFGLVEMYRVDADIAGRPISEITYLPTYPNGGSLTLLKFNDATGPARGESIAGFTTTDIQALVDRVVAAGGRIADPIRSMPEHKLRVAFIEDPEGHLTEVVQMDA